MPMWDVGVCTRPARVERQLVRDGSPFPRWCPKERAADVDACHRWRGPGRGRHGEAAGRTGEQVRIVSRRGVGPDHPAVERIAADAADADRLSSITAGAAVLYNCANRLITAG
jgi:hypothetical protein